MHTRTCSAIFAARPAVVVILALTDTLSSQLRRSVRAGYHAAKTARAAFRLLVVPVCAGMDHEGAAAQVNHRHPRSKDRQRRTAVFLHHEIGQIAEVAVAIGSFVAPRGGGIVMATRGPGSPSSPAEGPHSAFS